MMIKDIFENEVSRTGDNKAIDISSDEGMWEYIDLYTTGHSAQWGLCEGSSFKRIISPSIRSEERIYIFGAGSAGGRTFKLLSDRDIDIEGFIDSSIHKQGTFYYGKRIWSVDEIAADSCIILSNQWFKEIYEMLQERINIESFRIYVDYANSLFYSESPLMHIPVHDTASGKDKEL